MKVFLWLHIILIWQISLITGGVFTPLKAAGDSFHAAAGGFYLKGWKITKKPYPQNNIRIIKLDGDENKAEMEQVTKWAHNYSGGSYESMPANKKFLTTITHSYHEWNAFPKVLVPGEKIKITLKVKGVLLASEAHTSNGVSTGLRIDTDKGGPIFTGIAEIGGVSGVSFPSGKWDIKQLEWVVSGKSKWLGITIENLVAPGGSTITYYYAWKDGPVSTGKFKEIPDISGVWIEQPNHKVIIHQDKDGNVKATCTYGNGQYSWVMRGKIDKSGLFVATLKHTKGVSPSVGGYTQKRFLQLDKNRKTLSGKAQWSGGGHPLTWIRQTSNNPASKNNTGNRSGQKEASLKEPATVSTLTVQAGKRRVKSGQIIKVPVWIIKGDKLANMNVEIHYDPKVIRAEQKVLKGNLLSKSMFQANPREKGRIRLGFAQAASLGSPGTGTMAQLYFKAVGKAGTKSPLTLKVTTATSDTGKKLRAKLLHGEVVVLSSSGFLPGDTTGTGELTAVDAMNALKMSVGNLPVNMVADMDGDKRVTANDATLILHKVVGK